MKKYYAERHGLLTKQLQIDFDELLQYFGQVYKYFCDKEYFEVATRGVWRQIPYTQDSEQILPPSLLPSPEVYFATCLQDKEVWPIWQYLEEYDEQTLFSVIEILYDHIGVYNYETDQFENEAQKEEFAEQINNILRAYKEGYYLEPTNGFIMQIPNGALREQLEYDGSDLPDSVYEQLATATEMYYRFDANLEQKKKAINILADILESEREEVKDTLNAEYEVPKNEHDKLIFGIVAEYLPYGMQKALDLIPLVGSSTDIFRTNTFRIFGKLIWSPYLIIIIPVLIGILCMPFAIKSWSRRMKA